MLLKLWIKFHRTWIFVQFCGIRINLYWFEKYCLFQPKIKLIPHQSFSEKVPRKKTFVNYNYSLYDVYYMFLRKSRDLLHKILSRDDAVGIVDRRIWNFEHFFIRIQLLYTFTFKSCYHKGDVFLTIYFIDKLRFWKITI